MKLLSGKKRNRRRTQTVSSAGRFRCWLTPRTGRLAVVALLATVSYAVWSMMLAEFNAIKGYDLKRVAIEGAFEHVSKSDIETVMRPYAHQPFFDLDIDGIRGQVEHLPWVKRAAVRRIWPDTLHVTVYEQHAIARWGQKGLLNRNGRLFYPAAGTGPDGLPRLAGVRHSEKLVLKRLQDINELLQPVGLSVVALALDPRRSWHATLDNGMQLVLGRVDNRRRLQRFIEIYPSVLAGRKDRVGAIDLRYPNGFVVRWRDDNKHSVFG